MRGAAVLALALVACGTDDEGRSSGSASGLTGLTTLGGTQGSATLGETEGGGSAEGPATAGTSPADGTADDTADDGVKFDLGEEDTDAMPPPEQCETMLLATVRDFSSSHPDFESTLGTDPGIVQTMLGGDGKPVYAGGTNGTTHGQANFDQWYRDVAGVNMNIPVQIALTDDGTGNYVYDNPAFFPIDGQGFGDEGNSHNYHFTLEMHTQFTYQGGEVFTFRGDDDLFTFINGRLGIDLGGVHGPQEGSIDLDAMAGTLGIAPGGTYDLDFFFAERHTSESNFRIETTIGCFHPPG